MRWRLLCLPWLLSACALLPGVETGRLHGEVWSASTCGAKRSAEEVATLPCRAQPVSVIVDIKGIGNGFATQVQSEASGRFVADVPPGEYLLTVEASGNRGPGRAQGTVAAGESKELWIHLGSRVK